MISKIKFINRCLVGLVSLFAVSLVLAISDNVLDKIRAEYGSDAVVRVQQWQQLISESGELTDREKLKNVNDFFNQQVEFVSDSFLWGKDDYWATPLEFLAKGAGDCEDYSIAKYFTLRQLGVSDEKLRITYVKALELNQAHMVLTYFITPRSVPLVLDNLIPVIKPALKRKDLLPVYSFNGSGLWLAKSRGNGKRVGGSSRLSLWGELKRRMKEGK